MRIYVKVGQDGAHFGEFIFKFDFIKIYNFTGRTIYSVDLMFAICFSILEHLGLDKRGCHRHQACNLRVIRMVAVLASYFWKE